MSSLGKRSRADIASSMMKKARKTILARPRIQSNKGSRFEGVRAGVATSGSSGPEVKNLDTLVGVTDVTSTAPYVNSLTQNLAEGTGSSQRVGLKVLLKSIDLEVNFQTRENSTNGTGLVGLASFMDFFVVWDRQPDGTQATAAQILASTNTNLTFGNIGNLERFTILRRHRVELDSSDAGQIWNVHIPLALATRFADATAVPFTNDVLVLAVSPSPAVGVGVQNPGMSYIARLKYTDA